MAEKAPDTLHRDLFTTRSDISHHAGRSIYIFRGDSLGGASQIVLLIATSICSLIAVFHCKIKWEDIEGQIARNIYGIAPSVIILLLIGTLSGSWMVSGIVPSLIYYGLQVMQTDFFLVACCLLCSIVSVMTGSSWTTIATIGIALIGIGEAQGFSTGWVAERLYRALISGIRSHRSRTRRY